MRPLRALEPSDDARRRKNKRFQLAEYAMKNADCRGRVWSPFGTESGSEAGQPMLVEKAICGLRRSGAAFTALLVTTLDVIRSLRSIDGHAETSPGNTRV